MPDELDRHISTLIAVVTVLATIFGAYLKIKNQLDGLGVRVNETERDLARQRGQIEGIKDEFSDDRLAIMTQLHNSEKNAAEREARLREQLARIEEPMNIDRMIGSAIQKLEMRRAQ